MKDKIFINSWIYRIFFPLVSGLLAYILILMIFDSLNQLKDNFFSQEALFTVIMSYSISESFILMVRLLDKYLPFKSSYRFRQSAQVLITVFLNTIVTSILVAGYFNLVVGYSGFLSEWIAFNLIFILFYLMINVYYLSHHNLFRHQSILLEKEQQLKINLVLELEKFKNDIHPRLLFGCLETMIGLIGADRKEADNYVMILSRQYRNILDNKKNELIQITKEIDSVNDILYLLQFRYQHSINLEVRLPEKLRDGFLVPGTLAFLAEEIIFNNIISKYQPLKLIIDVDDRDTIILKYRSNPVLDGDNYNSGKMNMINNTYSYFSGRMISTLKSDGIMMYKIPILSLENESSIN